MPNFGFHPKNRYPKKTMERKHIDVWVLFHTRQWKCFCVVLSSSRRQTSGKKSPLFASWQQHRAGGRTSAPSESVGSGGALVSLSLPLATLLPRLTALHSSHLAWLPSVQTVKMSRFHRMLSSALISTRPEHAHAMHVCPCLP